MCYFCSLYWHGENRLNTILWIGSGTNISFFVLWKSLPFHFSAEYVFLVQASYLTFPTFDSTSKVIKKRIRSSPVVGCDQLKNKANSQEIMIKMWSFQTFSLLYNVICLQLISIYMCILTGGASCLQRMKIILFLCGCVG